MKIDSTSVLPQELEAELAVPFVNSASRRTAVTGGGYWPTLFPLKDSSLFAVMRGGAPHVGVDSRIDGIRSTDGGEHWSQPQTIVPGHSRLDMRGAAAGCTANGTIVVAYNETDWFSTGKFSVQHRTWKSYYVYSTDQGKTWSEKIHLTVEPLGDPGFYGRISVLPDGTALMAVYGTAYPRRSGLMRSRDHGRTWGELSIIAEGFHETTLLPFPDGRILAFMRDDQSGGGSGTFLCESMDQGKTWNNPRRLTKPFQHPADATMLKSGALLLTYGNRIGDLAVGAMLSDDLGRTWDWDHRVVLARDSLVLKGKHWGDCGYPSTVQLANGSIVTLYYRLGTNQLPPNEQEQCLQYERDAFENPPASPDMRRFEEGICIHYTEDKIRRR